MDTYGIQELWRPVGIEPEIDIVAVHGLNGGARRTWTSRTGDVCWLNHPDYLPKYITRARVLTWGYNSSFSSLVGDEPAKDRIHQHAHTLVANLSANRGINRMNTKPIIFLCHSLGGIIVKRALSYSHTRTGHKVSHEYNIFASTYGILFFGTPHFGSEKANWLAYLKKVSMTSHSDLVSALAKESETLQNITDYFVPLMKNFNIFFFWEQRMTEIKFGKKDYIVSVESAAPTFDETERAGIAADHSGMVKFDDPSSQAFQMVIEALMRYCDQAPEAILRKRHFAAELLDQERKNQAMEVLSSIRNPFSTPPSTSRVQSFDGGRTITGFASVHSLSAPQDS